LRWVCEALPHRGTRNATFLCVAHTCSLNDSEKVWVLAYGNRFGIRVLEGHYSRNGPPIDCNDNRAFVYLLGIFR
jgi:hypothetical protein